MDENLTLLLSKAKSGCRDSQNALFSSFESYLLAISNCELDHRLKSKCGSSDIVQMTMAKASVALESFQGSTSNEFRSWLRTILINEIHQIRRRFATAARDAKLERPLQDSNQDSGCEHQIASPDLTPRSDFIRQEQIQHLRHALEQLPEYDQTIIKLKNWERWSFSRIAEHMDKSEESVKKAWQRAIAKLDKLI